MPNPLALQVQTFNPLAIDQQIAQTKEADARNQLAALTIQQHQQAMDEANRERSAYQQFGTDPNANAQTLFKAGLGKQAGAYLKSNADQQKDLADAEKKKLETAKDRVALVNQIAGSAKDQTSYQQGLATLQANGIDVSKLPPVYDPAYVENAKAQSLTELDRLNQEWKKRGYDLDVRKQNANERHDKATEAITVRGQNMTDARARDLNAITQQGNAAKNETELRKEFDQLPEVKSYKAAYPSFAAIKDAASRTGPQADINLIYGIAKLYDPNSVVREGEYGTIANSQAIPERIKGYAQALMGGGKLTPETKRQLLQEAEGRVATYENEYSKARGSYEDIANQRGMNSSAVFANTGRFKNINVNGKSVSARQAPDGKFYVQQSGKYYEVQE